MNQHRVFRVETFRIIGEYTINVEFNDGTTQTIDFEPVLEGELLGPLQDRALFNQVTIDDEVKTLVWPNGADFDPATLHDWGEHVGKLEAMAKRWVVEATT